MKKILIFLLLILIINPTVIHASSTPYGTFSIGTGDWMIRTQTAYTPYQTVVFEGNEPEDLFVDQDGTLYIADTKNSRILIIANNESRSIGEGILTEPKGVYVKDSKVYVADSGNGKVHLFDKEGKLLQEFGKPDSPLFGKNEKFLPKKIAVDRKENLYVVLESAPNGVALLNNQGEFFSYFASNRTNTSAKMIMQRMFYTQKQKSQLLKNLPPSVTNVCLDESGLLYTVTMDQRNNPLKKFNISGKNLLENKLHYYNTSFIDLDVNDKGNIYAIDNYGAIFEYDSFGNLLFIFGGYSHEDERVGLINSPSAIDVTDDGYIYALDKQKSIIQIYKSTSFADEVHTGVNLYKDGFYTKGQVVWEDVLKMNNQFILSYQALAKAYFKNGETQKALEAFELAEDRTGYSQAFWEVRNDWLQKNLGIFILLFLLLSLVWMIVGRLEKKKGFLKKQLSRITEKPYIAQFLFTRQILRKPTDAYYDLKVMGKASVLSATVLYLWMLILQITNIYVKGFLFRSGSIIYSNLVEEILWVAIPLALWIVANYMISTINEGEGKFRDVYVGTAYAFTPYLLGMLPLQLITNVLTINESFIYTFGHTIILAWSGVLLFLMVKEIHNYQFFETVKIILITLFCMSLMVLLGLLIYILVDTQYEFIYSILQELRIRG